MGEDRAEPAIDREPPHPTSLSQLDEWVRRRRWLADTALAAALGLVLLPTSLALVWGTTWSATAQAALVLVLLVGHLTVAARRLQPVAAYVVCCLVMLTLVLTPDVAGAGASEFAGQEVPPILLPSALVFPVVLYSTAAYTRRPWPMAALVVGLVGAAMTAIRLWTPSVATAQQVGTDTAAWRFFAVLALVAAVLAPWALGRFRGVRAAYVEALEERAARAERDRLVRADQAAAAERSRIAREMHDVVAHSLAVIVRLAEGGRFAAVKDPQRAAEALTTVAATGREALTDMRAVLGVLRDQATDGAAADVSPQPTVDDIPVLVDRLRATGLVVDLVTTGSPLALERSVSLAAYRVVQEALTNVVKHGGHRATATVRLDWADGGLTVVVEDDGGGTASGSADRGAADRVSTHDEVDGVGRGRQLAGGPGDSGSARGGSARGGPADGVRDDGDQVDGGLVDGGLVDGGLVDGGQGLVGMRERVALAGGHLDAGPRRHGAGHHGFAVRAKLPARRREEQ